MKDSETNVMEKPIEIVLFTGIPASGKTTFYRERYFPSHVYISLDQLKSRSAEKELLEFCLKRRRDCVIDNTNVKRSNRRPYIEMAKSRGVRIVGFCFVTRKEDAILRNAQREGRARVREAAVRTMYKELEYPRLDEGYDELNFVTFGDGTFKVEGYDEERVK